MDRWVEARADWQRRKLQAAGENLYLQCMVDQRCGGGSCGRNGTCTTLEGRQEVCRNICIFEVSVVDIEKVYNVVLCRVA